MVTQNFNPNPNHWCVDLSNDMLKNPEIFDGDVIEQSVINILSCNFFEWIFSNFGSGLPDLLFNNFTSKQGDALVQSLIDDIKAVEDRIIIDEQNVNLIWDSKSNNLQISIPYLILENGRSSVFNKTVSL